MADPLTREGDGILGSDEIFSRSKVGPQDGAFQGQSSYTMPHPQQETGPDPAAMKAAAMAQNPPKSFCKKSKLGATPAWIAALIVAPGQLIYAMEAVCFAVNLPIISDRLGVDTSVVQWVIHSELLICCGFGCLAPKLAEKFGISYVYIASSYTFGLFTFLITFFPGNLPMVIICRLLASFGLALLLPLGNPMAYMMTSKAKLPIVLTVNSAATPIGTIFSSLVSGAIAQSSEWSYMMTIIGLFSMLHATYSIFLCLRIRGNKAAKIDWIGALLIIVAVTLIIFGFTSISEAMPWYAGTLSLLFGAGVFVIFFFWNTRWSKCPLYVKSAFNPSVAKNLVAMLMASCMYFGERFFFPYIIVRYYEYNSIQNGLFSAIGGVLSIAFSPLFTFANKKIVARVIIIIFGLTYLVAMSIEAIFLHVHEALVVIMGTICIVSFIALLISIQTASMANTPAKYAPTIGSLNSIMTNLGHSVGIALAVTVQSDVTRSLSSAGDTNEPEVLQSSIKAGILSCTFFGAVLVINAFFMGVLKSDRGKCGFSERILARTKHFPENINNSGEMVEIQGDTYEAAQEQQAVTSLYQPKFL